MKRSFRWLMCMVVAGWLLASAAVTVPCQDGNLEAGSSKAVKDQHRRELQDQRRRVKQSRQDIRTKVRQSGPRAKPPKAERHQTRKVQNQAKSQNAELRRAQKNSRKRRPSHPRALTN
jgi:hypothetical protein